MTESTIVMTVLACSALWIFSAGPFDIIHLEIGVRNTGNAASRTPFSGYGSSEMEFPGVSRLSGAFPLTLRLLREMNQHQFVVALSPSKTILGNKK
jgi:hypothetical protein